jgi:hypothetical protein
VPDRAEALAEVAFDALRRLVRERQARLPGGHLVEGALDEIDLALALSLAPEDPRVGERARGLVDEIDRILAEAIQHVVAFRPGRVWCHRCGTSACEHGAPPSSRHVFTGYGPTGTPRWDDFAQLCLERKHPQVDRLYDALPALLTIVHEPAALESSVLDAFRDPYYELLGQVSAGFFVLPGRAENGRGVLALTVQAVASRSERGTVRLGLNLLGGAVANDAIELPWRPAVRWAQHALHGLTEGRRRHPGRSELERRVAGILAGLARRLEHDHRARGRRTSHAEERHRSRERPTRHALGDARRAADAALYRDERSGAIVVLGERGRTHFFTVEGRLVSSVRYGKDAIARKIHGELWRRATAAEVARFRERLTSEPSPHASEPGER